MLPLGGPENTHWNLVPALTNVSTCQGWSRRKPAMMEQTSDAVTTLTTAVPTIRSGALGGDAFNVGRRSVLDDLESVLPREDIFELVVLHAMAQIGNEERRAGWRWHTRMVMMLCGGRGDGRRGRGHESSVRNQGAVVDHVGTRYLCGRGVMCSVQCGQ